MNNIVYAILPFLLFGAVLGLLLKGRFPRVFIESFNHRREVTLTGGRTLSTPMTLSELGELLRPFPEFRSPHRAYLVNLNFVTGIGGAEVFVGEERISIAKSGLRAFKEDYLEFCFSK